MDNQSGVNFGGGGIASVAGVFGGVAIAIGVPWVILVHGQILSQGIITTLVLIAVIGGVFISFISAFFGLVMPSSVHDQWNPEKLRQMKEFKEQNKKSKLSQENN